MAAEFNMSSLLGALESTKVDTIKMAATLDELKRSLEDQPRFKHHSKHTRKENALKSQIAEIEKELTVLQTRMKSRVDRMERAHAMAARKGENTMRINADDVHDLMKFVQKCHLFVPIYMICKRTYVMLQKRKH